MKLLAYAALLVLLLIAAPQAVSAQPTDKPLPVIRTVTPEIASVGTIVTGHGEALNARLVDVYLTDGKKDYRLTIVEKSETAVKFKIPSTVPPGRFRLMVSTPEVPPVLVEQPAVLTIVTLPTGG